MRLFDEIRYFFYITNDRKIKAEGVVFEANDRCDQENLIAQLAGGVRALSAPVDKGRGLDTNVRSFDIENQERLSLHREAAEYNARLRSFPCCLIAPALGFRPWRTHGRLAGNSQRRRGGQGGFRRRRP